jgi:thioredoxin 1
MEVISSRREVRIMTRHDAVKWKMLVAASLLSAIGLLGTSGCTFHRASSQKTARMAQPRATESAPQNGAPVPHANQTDFDERGSHSDVPSLGANPTSTAQPIRNESMSMTEKPPTVLHASQTSFNEQVLRSDVPVLVDFYADWCGPCKRLAPVLDELAAETPNAKIVKVNVDHSPDLAAEYGVQSLPSLKLFKNGRVTDQVVGLASKDRLRTMLTR